MAKRKEMMCLRKLIIVGFRKYHPQQPLLHEEYDSLKNHFLGQAHQGPLKEEAITEYMEKFVNWGNKEYGTNFKLESKLLFVWSGG